MNTTALATPPVAVAPSTTATRRGSRLPWLLGAAALSLAFTTFPLRDPDVWWHLAVGRLIRDHGIPATEPFSFAGAPNPWVGQQWLYELTLARLVDGGGAGVAMVAMGVLGAVAFLLAGLATRRGDDVPGIVSAAAMLAGGLAAAEVLGVRGQVVTVAGSAAVLLIVTRWRDGDRRVVWALPPLLLVWANLHAGFITGMAIALLAALTVGVHRRAGGTEAASVRLLLAALAAGAAATLVNPAGPRLWGYVAATFANPTLTNGIDEWSSPSFHSFWFRFLEVLVVGLVALWGLCRRPDPLDVVLAVATVAATLQAQRNVAILAVVITPQLARYAMLAWRAHAVAPEAALRRRRRPLPAPVVAALALVTAAVSLVAVVLPAASAEATARWEREHEPAAAATWARTHLAGQRLYSTYEWGGYLAERLGDMRMVWIYGESAIFGDARLREYLAVHDLEPSWRDVLDANGMRHALLPVGARETVALLEVGWRPLCADAAAGAVVLEAGPPPAPGAAPADAAAAPAC